MTIKLWDWDKKWQCSQVFEGHSHYVMMIVINPKDHNQFASASLDRTIKVRREGKRERAGERERGRENRKERGREREGEREGGRVGGREKEGRSS